MGTLPPSEPSRIALDGGVASDICIVVDAAGREIVIKEALPKLKVAADWRSDPARSSVEVEALRTIRELLGPGTVPEVLWTDAARHRFAMERIDARVRNWKTHLLQGHIDLETAARAGELLGALHTRSALRADLATRFANRDYFEQLRVVPFLVRIAERNALLEEPIHRVIEALRAPGRALVHGDYSPKNLLVDGYRVVILDCEVAHWGNPHFDVAFCLSHLMLKGLRRAAPVRKLGEAALVYLNAYQREAATVALDAELVRLTGCLILARLEGDSPVDYRADLDLLDVKSVATQLISTPANAPTAALEDILLRKRGLR